ncbi:uncharacterized protein LOC135463672 [Liolophura sinensis]|uniref:uncharacterized protein LOC135463672 n=1 Tax=Liolophura sinensis TaxID=3198878 RepID=UPI0031583F7B
MTFSTGLSWLHRFSLFTFALCILGCPMDHFSQESPKDVSPIPTVFQTSRLPHDNSTNGIDFRYMASVGNGHLATVVYSDTIYVNGLYNGVLGWSHRARIPSTQAIRIQVAGKQCNTTREYSLDVARGVFEEVLAVDGMGGRVVQRTYAHQRFTRLLITEVMVDRQSTTGQPFVIELRNYPGKESTDIKFSEQVDFVNNIWPSYQQNGTTLEAELNMTTASGIGSQSPDDNEGVLQTVNMLSTKLPNSLTLDSHQQKGRWIFFTSIDLNYTSAKTEFQNGLDILSNAPDYLYQSHIKAWESRWNGGRIEVSGNLQLQKLIYGSFYYLLSSLPSMESNLPANQFYGLSPGGLSNGANATDYQGHVFWDMETWMYPTMLMFHPKLAKEMLSYRNNGMEFAYERARDGGYAGLRFPWQSALTGAELTTVCIPCRDNEQHITGDIGFAARQYLTATRDTDWLKSEQGYQLIRDIAFFWATRATYSADKDAYDIDGVMPPDEYAQSVNNSVYTNVLAKKSILFARYAACLNDLDYSKEINDSLISKAENIFIPFNQSSRYHPEFEGYESYDNGTHKVKQADVILLGYPLMYDMDIDVRRNDLEKYEKVTDEGGPAMTWGMFAIGWLELGDEQRAAGLFNKSHSPYTREPFKIWTEDHYGHGAVNFITGMGGFLQAVFFGYGGVRLQVEQLTFDPRLPPGTDGMKLIDVDYLGSRFDVIIKAERVQINVTEAPLGSELILTVSSDGSQFLLTKGRLIDMAREAFSLKGSEETDCPVPEGSSCSPGVPWSDLSPTPSVSPSSGVLTNPVNYIVLTHTQGKGCHTMLDCKYQASNYSNDYNYLVGENGIAYEGVGSRFTSGVMTQLTNRAITIAVMGDFKCTAPNTKAFAAVKRIAKCLLESGKLSRNYTVLTLEQATDSGSSTERDDAMFCVIKQWKHWQSFQSSGELRYPRCDRLCDRETDYTFQSDGFTDLSEEPHIFRTDRLPMVAGSQSVDTRYMPSVGNGHIATVLYSSSVYMNGLFNGYKGNSHRARIPSLHNVRASLTGTSDQESWSYSLDVKKGVFEERHETPNATVLVRTYAHQHYTQLLVTEVRVHRSEGHRGNVTIQLENFPGKPSADIDFSQHQQYYDKENRLIEGCFWRRGVTKQSEWNTSSTQEVYQYWKRLDTELVLLEAQESETWIYISALDSDKTRAATVFQSGLWRIGDGSDRLYHSHAEAWRQKWDNGQIELEGSTHLSKLAHSSQYYLLSSLPSLTPNFPNEQFYGLSSDTLARGGSGHVQWYMDAVLFPPVLLFHPELAKAILSYRGLTMPAAYERGESGGLWFPWESGVTGMDITPDISSCTTCADSAKHVSGDIAMAAHQYLILTQDIDWLKEEGYKLMRDIARFWKQQLLWDDQKHVYVINNVTPPDELAGSVNNSAYTNYLARLNIHQSRYAACIKSRNYKNEITDEWLKMADGIFVPFDSVKMGNLEYEGFTAVDVFSRA